jgi:acyl-ACP thioesterase
MIFQSVGYRFMQDLFKDVNNSIYVSRMEKYYKSIANTGEIVKYISASTQ